MTTDNEKAGKSDSDNSKEKLNSEDPAVQRGKLVIEIQKQLDSDPEDVKKAKQEKDAEKWRNEG